MTQTELADRAGLARSTVTRLETLAQGDIGLSVFLRLLAAAGYDMKVVVGGMSIGRVTVTPEGVVPGPELDPLAIEELVAGENTAERFTQLVRKYARAAISGAVPKFLAPEIATDRVEPLGKSTLRTSRHIIKGSDDNTPYLGFNQYYTMQVLERLSGRRASRCRNSSSLASAFRRETMPRWSSSCATRRWLSAAR